MSNGSSNGGSNDEGQAEGGSLIPQVFSEVLFIGDGFGDKDEVEGEGWVWVTGVDEVGGVLVALEELPDVVDGRREGIGLELGGRHNEVGVDLQKAGWLVASVRQLSEDLLQFLPPFITLKNLGSILQIAF